MNQDMTKDCIKQLYNWIYWGIHFFWTIVQKILGNLWRNGKEKSHVKQRMEKGRILWKTEKGRNEFSSHQVEGLTLLCWLILKHGFWYSLIINCEKRISDDNIKKFGSLFKKFLWLNLDISFLKNWIVFS